VVLSFARAGLVAGAEGAVVGDVVAGEVVVAAGGVVVEGAAVAAGVVLVRGVTVEVPVGAGGAVVESGAVVEVDACVAARARAVRDGDSADSSVCRGSAGARACELCGTGPMAAPSTMPIANSAAASAPLTLTDGSRAPLREDGDTRGDGPLREDGGEDGGIPGEGGVEEVDAGMAEGEDWTGLGCLGGCRGAEE
jgi:hypothetical protein